MAIMMSTKMVTSTEILNLQIFSIKKTLTKLVILGLQFPPQMHIITDITMSALLYICLL